MLKCNTSKCMRKMQRFTSAANQTENLKVEILTYFFKNFTN